MTAPDFPYHLFNKTPWKSSMSALWPTSLFSIRRNLTRAPYPHQQSPSQALYVMETLYEAFKKSRICKDPVLLEFSLLSPLQKEFIFEHFFIPDGIVEERPHQGIIIDTSGTFIAVINCTDHLLLHHIDYSSNWHESWHHLQTMEKALSQHLEYSFSAKFGYLTSNVCHCGTGLSIKACLHLPAILHATEQTPPFEMEKNDDFIFSSIKLDTTQEDTIPFEGDLVFLHNKFHLGVSEDRLIHQLYGIANRLINSERELRSQIKAGDMASMKDLVCRSFGILLHSYQLPTQEALAALSFFKLGIDLGWIEHVSDVHINNLFFQCRRGHLLIEEDSLSHEELLHKRASLIHTALKNAKLTI